LMLQGTSTKYFCCRK